MTFKDLIKRHRAALICVVLVFLALSLFFQLFSLFPTRRLVRAIKKDNVTAAERWLKRGIDPDVSATPSNVPYVFISRTAEAYSPERPILYACINQDEDMVRLLLSYGARPDYSAFWWIFNKEPLTDGSVAIVKILLENGGFYSMRESVQEFKPHTDIRYEYSLIGDLMRNSSDRPEESESATRCAILMLEYSGDFYRQYDELLYDAAKCRNAELVAYLLENGWPQTYADPIGRTAYGLAQEKGYADIVRIFDDFNGK